MDRSGGGTVVVVAAKGCLRPFVGGRTSISSAGGASEAPLQLMGSSGPVPARPFDGLVICVTGLSREARDQVMAATERLGGQYSASLHPKCTHLVVQSFSGRKFEHALKHGPGNGLLIVTLGWFVDSVKKNARLSESLYSVKRIQQNGILLRELHHPVSLPGSEKSCLPSAAFDDEKLTVRGEQRKQIQLFSKECNSKCFSADDTIYIDPGISGDIKKKIIDATSRDGIKILDHWFVGAGVTYIVCESSSVQRYIGHSNNIVTPLWILKTVKEKSMQRLVHLSVDLARQVATVLENVQDTDDRVDPAASYSEAHPKACKVMKENLEERKKLVDLAKQGVRERRSRCMQSCLVPIRPITPSSLLETICWSISEPTSSACIYMDSSTSEDASEHQTTFFDAKGDGRDLELSNQNTMRGLNESERLELILKSHFVTILFPVDRLGELGPSSRTYFSSGGFTCIQILDLIYNFYHENMTASEIEVALHTDSRHADRLRSAYASAEVTDGYLVPFRRIDFMGSRKSFEVLKRVNWECNANVYELVVRA